MQYIIGAVFGVGLFIGGFALGLRLSKTQEPRNQEPTITDAERRQIEALEERERQWENLMNYTGKVQVGQHED